MSLIECLMYLALVFLFSHCWCASFFSHAPIHLLFVYRWARRKHKAAVELGDI